MNLIRTMISFSLTPGAALLGALLSSCGATPDTGSVERDGAETAQVEQDLGYLACKHNCDVAFQNCDNACTSRPRPGCEENCDQRHNTCLASCGCPTFSDSVTSTERVAVSVADANECLGGPYGLPGQLYVPYYTKIRTIMTRRTENCDGSVSYTQLPPVESDGGICYTKRRPNRACNFSTSPTYGDCIF